MFGVGTVDRDGLVVAGQIGDLRFDDVVEGTTKEDVVGYLSHDLSLEIDDDAGEKEGDIGGDAEGEIALGVGGLHADAM